MAKGTLVFEDGTIYRVAFEPVQVQAPPAAPPPPPEPPKVPITAINCRCTHTAEYHHSETGHCNALSVGGDPCPCREYSFPGDAPSIGPPHKFNPGDSVACRTCGLDYYAHNAKENR